MAPGITPTAKAPYKAHAEDGAYDLFADLPEGELKLEAGTTKIILLNTQYAGSGIDINCATDVIIYHSMGIDKQQAIGRAQRVGRTSELYIHNLYYEHEI